MREGWPGTRSTCSQATGDLGFSISLPALCFRPPPLQDFLCRVVGAFQEKHVVVDPVDELVIPGNIALRYRDAKALEVLLPGAKSPQARFAPAAGHQVQMVKEQVTRSPLPDHRDDLDLSSVRLAKADIDVPPLDHAPLGPCQAFLFLAAREDP